LREFFIPKALSYQFQIIIGNTYKTYVNIRDMREVLCLIKWI